MSSENNNNPILEAATITPELQIVKGTFLQIEMMVREIHCLQAEIVQLKAQFDKTILPVERDALKERILNLGMKIAELRIEEKEAGELLNAECVIIQCKTCPRIETVRVELIDKLVVKQEYYICPACWLREYESKEGA